jgi:predicted dinucleotide-binding enzyme
VLHLVESLGFDAVDGGNLESGLALQPGGPIFGAGHSAADLSKRLAVEAATVQT